MSQQVGSAVSSYCYLMHPMHPKTQMHNEYQVIFLPDNGKSRSMKDNKLKVDKTTKNGYAKAVVWGTIGKGDKEWFTVWVSPFQFTPTWQTSQ